MSFIKIDINGDVVEQSEDRPSGKLPEPDRVIHEIPGLQIVEIEQTPDKGHSIPPWMIPGILEIIDGNRDKLKKRLPN